MKQFWKKTNRGLWLGLILLIVLVTFIAVKQAQFKREVPTLRDNAKAYVTDALALNLYPDGVTVGATLTDAQKEEQMQKMNNLLEKYWKTNVSEKDIKDESVSGDTLADIYRKNLDGKCLTVFRSLSFSVNDRDVTVKADGPDRAVVSIYCDQNSADFYGSGVVFLTGENFLSLEDPPKDPLGGSSLMRSEYSLNLELEYQRVGGNWKIISVGGYLGAYSYYPIEEEGN